LEAGGVDARVDEDGAVFHLRGGAVRLMPSRAAVDGVPVEATERWDARPSGVEQTWVVASAPAGAERLSLALSVEGATVSAAGDGLRWQAPGGGALRVGGLRAWDARGARVPARFEGIGGDHFSIVADVSDVSWPVTVDPLVHIASTRVTGPGPDLFAEIVGAVGDIDQDGRPEVAITASRANGFDGAVYLHRGTADGFEVAPFRTVRGASGVGLGTAIAALGRVNDDDVDDYAIAARQSGVVWVMHGDATTPSTILDEGRTVDEVAGAPGLNGDRHGDLLVAWCEHGEVGVHLGGPAGISAAQASAIAVTPSFSCGVDSVGDVDHDGFDDVVIGDGAFGGGGRARLFLGGAAGLNPVPAQTLFGGVPGAMFGDQVIGIGDVNGDGHPDLGVIAPDYAALVGRAYVYLGNGVGFETAPHLALFEPTAVIDSFAGRADVDGDGFGDLAVGLSTLGTVRVYHGSPGGLARPPTSVEGESVSFGYDLASPGDVDGDGLADLLVGAPSDGIGGPGAAALHRGVRDDDRDGAGALVDCDDLDPARFPGAAEADGAGVDTNCDGVVFCFRDADGDGVRTDAALPSEDLDCADPGEAGVGVRAGDCDDLEPAVRPGAEEVPGDGVDGDCDGLEVCHVDVDGDGQPSGRVTEPVAALDCVGDGFTASAAPIDCDDQDAARAFGNLEQPGDGVDQDCDSFELCYFDQDGDGFPGDTTVTGDLVCAGLGLFDAGEAPHDCDDGDAAISPGAPDVIGSGVAEDCVLGVTCGRDGDGDGVSGGGVVSSPDDACDAPGEAMPGMSDCDDTNADVRPAAVEVPGDGVDADCDLQERCFVDVDGDGWHAGQTALSFTLDCGVAGLVDGTAPGGDCDDGRARVNPGASEDVADAIDADCDGVEACWGDGDGDGQTNGTTVGSVLLDCTGPGATGAALPIDCDDGDAAVFHGAVELPGDGRDQDCDRVESCFQDEDRDGWRTGQAVPSPVIACDAAGLARAEVPDGDCDDADPSVYPGAPDDPLDGVDQDCDGAVFCALDADRDGAAAPGQSVRSADADCDDAGEAPVGAPVDCDDGDGAVLPGATERIADGVDQDCDGNERCFADEDDDGFAAVTGDVVSFDLDCLDLGEAVSAVPRTDCDDGEAAVFPGATEDAGDGVDQDCDGLDACFADADEDGVRTDLTVGPSALACDGPGEALAAAPRGDCDDTRADTRPGAAEQVGDGRDNDCDGQEVCFQDDDGDGWRTAVSVVSVDGDCADPGEALAAAPSPDCADDDPDVFPGAGEVPADGVDGDCDGSDGGATCFVDADGDGARVDATVVSADGDCDDPGEAGGDAPGPDCDDGDAAVGQLAVERVDDGVDQDCDGLELCFVDADEDGLRPDATATITSPDLQCVDGPAADGQTPVGDCDDGDEDPDQDGLVDPEEVLTLGTDPCDPDSDADGLADGAEVTLHGTDPLVADSDDGGVSDGDEIANGTDPLDPADDQPATDKDAPTPPDGCACAEPGSAGGSWAVVAALAAARRRRVAVGSRGGACPPSA
jgi:hypothetical protein